MYVSSILTGAKVIIIFLFATSVVKSRKVFKVIKLEAVS